MGAMQSLKKRLNNLREANPMMGLRGCRLGILHPAITRMQVAAIIEAACAAAARGADVRPPHIMVPLVGFIEELDNQVALIHSAAEEAFNSMGACCSYTVGTMIEVPRGALMAGELAKRVQFFSFGTNDLTQMTLGFSRDDAEAKFIRPYIDAGILQGDPFKTLDEDGVGQLVRMAAEQGRAANPDLELGVCGEHGGDPKSIEFVARVGVDYVSCSPLRVPVARLAAAQAAIKAGQVGGTDHCQD
jgi:pyruvate, orthophosphate dikinase